MTQYFVMSDIHGDVECLKKALECYEQERCAAGAEAAGSDSAASEHCVPNAEAAGSNLKILLLGDLLYHGPRNDLPAGYNPKATIALLNEHKEKFLTVRGNCEAEVDQMVLKFPVMAQYLILPLGRRTLKVMHGHQPVNQLFLSDGEIYLQGHTHLYLAEEAPLPDEDYPGAKRAGETQVGQQGTAAQAANALAEAENKPRGHYIHLNPGSISLPKQGRPKTYAMLDEEKFTVKTLEGEVVIEYYFNGGLS